MPLDTVLISFLISVLAGIVASFIYDIICKWLNRRKK